MRAREFIVEQNGSLQADVAAALPATYVIPALQNQDPYNQYRFGVAIARAKGKSVDGESNYSGASVWGENQVVVSYSNTIDQYIDDALKEIGLSPSDKKLITSSRSEETDTVYTVSPVAQWNKK